MARIAAKVQHLTENRTYKLNGNIAPLYIVVHSTATGRYKGWQNLHKSWNKASASKSCHGMVDAVEFAQTLPYDVRGWHAGPDGNGISIGFEICEPPNIAYTNAAHSRVDAKKYDPTDPAIRADFLKRYTNAVYMAAHMCQETGIKPDRVLCHAEMHSIGKATNHADVLHWFPLFGEQFTMDAFRRDVAAVLAGKKLDKRFPSTDRPTENSPVAAGAVSFKVRTVSLPLEVYDMPGVARPPKRVLHEHGTFTIVEVVNGMGRMKSGLGWIDLSKVQRR